MLRCNGESFKRRGIGIFLAMSVTAMLHQAIALP